MSPASQISAMAYRHLMMWSVFATVAFSQLLPLSFPRRHELNKQDKLTEVYSRQNQIVLGPGQYADAKDYHASSEVDDILPPFQAGNFTKRAQSNDICATYGENQWAGTIDISDERRLFYWFFDSRNDPENDPIIMWTNGGPGGSSMMGLFAELGPCMVPANKSYTVPNPYSWNNNASLLFIDQPAGVGFSSIKPGTSYAAGDVEGARDLQTFLRLFFEKVFPDRAHLPIHLAGESYGGHYIPVTMAQILHSRQHRSLDAFWGNLQGMILVNSLIDRVQITIGLYQLMCTNYRGQLWNQTTCDNLAKVLPEVEALGRSCDVAYDGRLCEAIELTATPYGVDILMEEVIAGNRSWYNVNRPCRAGLEGLCFPETKGNHTTYLNQPHVLESLGFSDKFTYYPGSLEAGMAYADTFDVYRPTTRELGYILDSHHLPSRQSDTPNEPIRLLVLNGNEDGLCNSPGQKWAYEKLSWSGAAGYRAAEWKSLQEVDFDDAKDENEEEPVKGEWKESGDGQLVFAAVEGAGHMVPGDKPQAADKIIRRWLAGWKDVGQLA